MFVGIGNFDPRQGFPSAPVGRIAHVDQRGRARVVAEHLAFPNGMAVTPDGRRLIVAESHASRLTAFTITEEGDLVHRHVWAELEDAAPDGIALGADGTCWYADVPAH